MELKFKETPVTTARPDDRGRITLGSTFTDGVSKYDVFVNEETGDVLLKPYKEIPANEAWFYKNQTAQNLVMQGLESAKAGKLTEINLEDSSWIDDIEDDE